VRAVALSSLVAAGAGIAVALVSRRRGAAVGFGVIGALAVAATVAVGSPEGVHRWTERLCAIAMLAVLAVSRRWLVGALGIDEVDVAGIASRMQARVRSVLRATGRAVALTLGRARHAVGRGARGAQRARTALLAAAAPARPRARPVLTTRDRIGAAAMATGALAYVAWGWEWARRVGWQPTGHAAAIMARAHDVGTVDHPLVGMATSFGSGGSASHPGPLAIDVLAPFVRLFGVQSGARLGGSAVVLVCWAVAVWAAWRAAGRVGAVVAWLVSLLVIEIAALGAVWEANNVTLTILAMFAAVVASWAAASGAWRSWWWSVGLGSLCAQAYLPHGLIVAGPMLWSGLALAGARRAASDEDEARRIRRALRGGWVILAVAWSQPLLDVVLHRGGNVRSLLAEVAHPSPPVGWSGAPRALAWIPALPPRWDLITTSFARAGNASDFIGGQVVTGGAVAILLAVVWWRTRRTVPSNERQLRIVTLLVVVGAAIDITQLPRDEIRAFQLGWLVVASLCLWFAVATSVALALRRRLAGWSSRQQWQRVIDIGAVCSLAAVLLAVGLARPTSIVDVKGGAFTIDAMVTPLVDRASRSLEPGRPTLVVALDDRLNEVATDTVMSNLIVRGLDARVPAPDVHYGQRRMVTRWKGPMLWVTNGLGPVHPVGTRIASAAMPGWSRGRFDALADDVAARLRSAGAVQLQPWVLPELPRYLAGWMGSASCTIAARIEQGTFPVASLPPGVLLSLAGDLAIRSPRLPRRMQDQSATLLGEAPLEVWHVERRSEAPSSPMGLMRDGSQCPSEPASS
jgi:hypothetical protein